jgi:hypothetical protein
MKSIIPTVAVIETIHPCDITVRVEIVEEARVDEIGHPTQPVD